MKADDCKDFKFEASHVLPKHPGKCSFLHGHSWKLSVSVRGEVNPETGMVIDFGDITKIVQPLIDDLDHNHLGAFHTDKIDIVMKEPKPINWLDQRNPTSENIIYQIGMELIRRGLKFNWLSLEETCTSRCVVYYEDVLSHLIKVEGLSKAASYAATKP